MANLSGEIVIDLTATRNGRRYPFTWVVEGGVPGTFTNEDAAVSREMPEQNAFQGCNYLVSTGFNPAMSGRVAFL